MIVFYRIKFLLINVIQIFALNNWHCFNFKNVMRGSRGGGRGSGPPLPPLLKNHKIIGFLCNTGPKNHNATKQAFNVKCWAIISQRNAIWMAFCWWADDGPLLCYLDPLSPPLIINFKNNNKKINVVRVEPPLTKLSGSAHECVKAWGGGLGG